MTNISHIQAITEAILRVKFTPPPYGILETPPYREAGYDRWSVKHRGMFKGAEGKVSCGAYFRIVEVEPDAKEWVLFEKDPVLSDDEKLHYSDRSLDPEGRVWMSTTPMELESQAIHNLFAYGHVVVCGLGMGALVWNLCKNPEVSKITVVEIEEDIVQLLKYSLPEIFECPKFFYTIADARKWRTNEKVDCLIADIWPLLGDRNVMPDMHAMQKHIKPDCVGWWGQEIEVADYLRKHNRHLPVTKDDIDEFCKKTGFNLMGRSAPAYHESVMDALTMIATSPKPEEVK